MAISTSELRESLKNIGSTIKNSVADVLESSGFISRTIGMNNSYEDIMYIVQALGREPVSLLGKDFTFIYDHVRRNYEQGTTIPGMMYGVDASGTGNEYSCPKFTFYKERPSIRFADPMTDNMNLLARWMPDFKLNITKYDKDGYYYAESKDEASNNIDIVNFTANAGTESGVIVTSIKSDGACDLIRKTNDNFKHGKYRTLVARFHTYSEDSKDPSNSTQTAISKTYGMSHGRNLLKEHHPGNPVNGYDNPYCRVWTYHHQYRAMEDAIRPFEDGAYNSAEEVRKEMGETSFRTIGEKGFEGGSVRLDTHGVLNYDNGLVNIAPKATIKNYFDDTDVDKNQKTISIKRCMFSIENLAWKGGNKGTVGINEYDPNGLSPEQKGPLGGRIMWFPPYDLKFNESSQAKWNSNEFIGRGENIYTYTNTERRGNLSFKLLIDHPSIVDYWERKDEETKYDGVDDVNSKESQLLRFFAGCEILKAKPQKYWHKEPILKPEDEKKSDEDDKDKNKSEAKYLYCFVYFPNNYSGIDDYETGKVRPFHYIANGIGTQKEIIVTNPFKSLPEDFAVDINAKLLDSTGEEIGYGGYEMRAGKGISYATEVLYPRDEDNIFNTFYEGTNQELITDADGLSWKMAAYKGGTIKYLAKQVYEKALTFQEADDSTLNGKEQKWFWQRWYYRVDKKYEDQKLHLKDGEQKNYLDTTSNQYNSVGYNTISNELKEAVHFVEDGNNKLVSFTDMFVALEDVNKDVYNGLYSDKNVEIVKEIKEGKKYKFIDAEFYGGASSQQNNANEKVNKQRNDSLADNRMLVFKRWLNSVGFPCMDEGDSKVGNKIFQTGGEKYDVNNSITKQWRCACVRIKYEEADKEPAQVVESVVEKDKDTNLTKVNSVSQPTPKTENAHFDNFSASPMGRKASVWQMETPTLSKPDEKLAAKYGTTNPMGIVTESGGKQTSYRQIKGDEIKSFMNVTGLSNTALAALGYTAPPQQDENKEEEKNNIVGYNTKEFDVNRYDNEGEFFKSLEDTDPFLHHLISEKIKYFDPAFHSISPEGFNARLTFLHQCTRQGPTVGNSDSNAMTAYNLAFGRPPVCVLRIGDFYYTKIIISSVDIDYDDMQWDLNPEGIGVMPMMANVRINFTFIGGSDLAGPISRLQNAVSFNYYANTGVYDNRAEMVEYDKGKVTKYKPYSYPDVGSMTFKKKRKGVVLVGDVDTTKDQPDVAKWGGINYSKGVNE